MEKHSDKTLKDENEIMENELIMMMYIFFTIITNKLVFKVP